MNDRLILVGGGAFARELIEWGQDAAEAGRGRAVTAFLADTPDAMSRRGVTLPYAGTIEDYIPQPGDGLLMAIGDPNAKQSIGTMLRARGARFEQLVHPSAVIARSAKLGEGVVICPQCVVSANVTLGELVALNCTTSVGHDAVVGDFSTLSAHVDLMGAAKLEACVFMGSGSRVLPKVTVKSGAKIGAGATIMRTVQEGVTMYIPPARRL